MQNLQVQVSDKSTGGSRQHSVVLDERELKRVSDFIGSEVGIQLPMTKRTLVESRLSKRLRVLGFTDFKSYLDYTLKSIDGALEKLQLIDVLTTNKTSFYREPDHFEYLVNYAIPAITKSSNGVRREINVWCAGCSTGEEAYTLSIELNRIEGAGEKVLFNILATDISHSCLSKASQGVYTDRQAESIPEELRKKYLLRSRNANEALVQMGPKLRHRIKFKNLNLMDTRFDAPKNMDIIFCRNVMIYFNNQLREELVAKFESHLAKGGYLFVGHSESLNGIKTTLKQVAPMVYKKSSEK
ncbi:Chemotaxis protein methyltransferase CheR [hydrothermal vent metagenome]|uniref:protein-glutamate O-methyltransferase n=1 Tax=hydrothermal vent metagenome TaxID=652676 RepID=A0A3B0WPS9_9ZZZZ